MGAASKFGALPGTKPDKKNQRQAHRTSFAAAAATDGIAKKEKVTPVSHAKVGGPDISRTALAAIGNHRTFILM
jgi:hypothetical protein